jgi:hypothetical protein
VAVGGTQFRGSGTKVSTWVNPNTGSQKFCSDEYATEFISIDPDSLAIIRRNIVKDIKISAITEGRDGVFAVGAARQNCRLENRVKIGKVNPNLDFSINFESRNVNSVDISDFKTLDSGLLLLAGRMDVFLPNVLANKALNITQVSNSLASNIWDESFWESGETHSAALLMLVTSNGALVADRVFPDQRGRGFAAIIATSSEHVLGVGRAFGDRGWAATIRVRP